MHVAALMPTRDRAVTAQRAVDTFLTAISELGQVTSVNLVVADDQSNNDEALRLLDAIRKLKAAHPGSGIHLIRTPPGTASTIEAPGGGPGVPRNLALASLRETCPRADVTIMFDDDVCFANADYGGSRQRCDGVRLLSEALAACVVPRTVAGCAYLGRQDLSILEHARVGHLRPNGQAAIQPAVERAGVENVAPGGISTAFLAVSAAPSELPDLPEHYNEDYVWLHALGRAGFPLVRVRPRLVHAPPGDVRIAADALSFQIHGEIVWLAILERERFPFEDPRAMAAAVEEIARDIADALGDPEVVRRPEASGILRQVLNHYRAVGSNIESGRPDAHATRLARDIAAGLRLAPTAP